MNDYTIYNNPLTTRYASEEMQRAFSDDKRFKLWRKLWIALAESQMELGLNVTQEQVDELKAFAEDIDYAGSSSWRVIRPSSDLGMNSVFTRGPMKPTVPIKTTMEMITTIVLWPMHQLIR